MSVSRNYPANYPGYMGILGYLDGGEGRGEVYRSRDDPGKYPGYMGIPGYLDKGEGGR